MTWTKNTSNWSNGDVPDEGDLDAYEDGIYRAHTMLDLAGLGNGLLASSGGPTLLLQLWRKAAAFTFGSSPVTSDGYFRTPSGGPWGADSITGLPHDRTTAETTVATGTTTDTLVLNRLFVLPAFASSITVSRVDVDAGFAFRTTNASYTATLDKVGLQVVKIAADGSETNVGSEVFESTTATDTGEALKHAQRYLSATGLSGTIAPTERLGIRLKLYAHSSNALGQVLATVCTSITEKFHFGTGTPGTGLQITGTPVAIWL